MEHRHHSRVLLGLEMLIYRRGMPIATGRIRDASLGGAFVETSHPDMREHQSLELEFRLPRATVAPEPQRVTGHVLRRSGDGFALEFDEENRASVLAVGVLLGAGPGATPAYPGAGAGVHGRG